MLKARVETEGTSSGLVGNTSNSNSNDGGGRCQWCQWWQRWQRWQRWQGRTWGRSPRRVFLDKPPFSDLQRARCLNGILVRLAGPIGTNAGY